MTIIMCIVGLFVFFISLPANGFTTALKRMMWLTLAGFAIDLALVVLTALVFATTF